MKIRMTRTVVRSDGTLFMQGAVMDAYIKHDSQMHLMSYNYPLPDDCWEAVISDQVLLALAHSERKNMEHNERVKRAKEAKEEEDHQPW